MPVKLVPPDRIDFTQVRVGECFFTWETGGKEYWIKINGDDAMNVLNGNIKTIGKATYCYPIKFTHTEVTAHALEATDDNPRTIATRSFKPFLGMRFVPNNRQVFSGACRYFEGPAKESRCVCYGDNGHITLETLDLTGCEVIVLNCISVERFSAYHTLTLEQITWST